MADKKISQTESGNVNKMAVLMDKLLTSVDKTYGRVENDLTNALTEIRILRWRIKKFNDFRVKQDAKFISEEIKRMTKQVEDSTVSIDRVAEKMKQQREQFEKNNHPVKDLSQAEFNRQMEAVPKPPPHATSMFPVPKDEEKDIEEE